MSEHNAANVQGKETTMTIYPKDAKPDQPYEVTVRGKRCTAQRVDPDGDDLPWRVMMPPRSLGEWNDDAEVSDLVPLVPARKVTRDDLPSVTQAQDVSIRAGGIIPSVLAVSEILDAVVAHLNANGGIPAENPRKPDYVLNNGKCCEEAALNAAEVGRLVRERDTLQRCVDAWVARGEKAEAERDEWQAKFNESNSNYEFWNQRCKEAADQRDELQRKLSTRTGEVAYWMDLFRERGEQIESLQEAAEQRPTLDREAVKRIVVRESHGSMTDRMDDALTDAIMALDLAAEQRPTLNREAVHDILIRFAHRKYSFERATEYILALALPEEDEQSAEEERIEEQVSQVSAMGEDDLREAIKNGRVRVENDA